MKLYRLKLTRTLANGVTGERTVGYFRTEADCENAIPEAKNNFNIGEDCGKFSIQESTVYKELHADHETGAADNK